jgi:hypothetical protein
MNEFNSRFYSYLLVSIACNTGYLGVLYDFDKILYYLLSILKLVWLVRTILGLKVFLSIVFCNNIDQKYYSIIRLVVISINTKPIPNFSSLLAYS